MAHVHVFEYDETSGIARVEYDAAMRRAGRIWNIVSIQSQLPEVMRDSMRIYFVFLRFSGVALLTCPAMPDVRVAVMGMRI